MTPEDRQRYTDHLRDRIAELEAALRPFAKLADTWTVQVAANEPRLLTVSNGERMCGIDAEAFIAARNVLQKP